MKRYTARIRHSAQTVLTMCKVQYSMFGFGRKVFMAFLAVILTIVGAANLNNLVGLLMAMFGCFVLTNLDYPAKNKADKVKDALQGEYPSNGYEFYDKHFVFLAQNQDVIDYNKLIGLVEDEAYLYLFINADGCYMMEKSSLGDELRNFMAFMSKVTGKNWVRPPKLSTFNLKTIVRMFKGEYMGRKESRKKKK